MTPVHAVEREPSIIINSSDLVTLSVIRAYKMPKKPTVMPTAKNGGIQEWVLDCMVLALERSSTASFSKSKPSYCALAFSAISAC